MAVDSHTVEVRFKSKQVDNLRLVGTAMAIIPRHIWQDVDDPMNFPNLDTPLGADRSSLKKRASGQYVVLETTGSHYRSNPKVDTPNFRVVKNEDVGVMSLRNRTVQMLEWSIDPAIVSDVLANPGRYPGVKVARGELASTTTLLFNLRKAPFDNVAFRRAVAYTVDARKVTDAALLGFANPAGPGLIPPSAGKYYGGQVLQREDRSARLLYREGEGDPR